MSRETGRNQRPHIFRKNAQSTSETPEIRGRVLPMNSLNRFADPVYCMVRAIVGLMYACHGGQKLFGFPGGGHGMGGLAFFAGIIELVAGFLIGFGLFTRIAAFFASGEM